MTKNIAGDNYKKFLDDLKSRVVTSRYKAALSANREMLLLYHHIMNHIKDMDGLTEDNLIFRLKLIL